MMLERRKHTVQDLFGVKAVDDPRPEGTALFCLRPFSSLFHLALVLLVVVIEGYHDGTFETLLVAVRDNDWSFEW